MDDCAQLCQDWQQHHLIPSDRQRQRPGKLSLGEVLFNGGALPSLPRQGPQAFLPLWGGAGVRHPLLSFPGTSRFVVLLGLAQRVPALWAGSLASSSICPSTTGARSWPSRSQGAMRDARQPLEPMTVLYGASSSAIRGYIVKPLMQRLWQQGLNLLTGCCTMKNLLLPLLDKRLPRKRSGIETLFATLRSEMGLEHSRHCSLINGFVHLLSCRAACSLWPQPGSTLAQSPSLIALDLIRNWGFSRHHCPWGRAPPPRCARESPDPTGGIVAKCTANPGQLAGHR